MTTRTEAAPVAGQHRPADHRSLLADWFPPRYWRGIGTAIRLAAVLLLLIEATTYSH